jgi:hypothetical protein
VRRGGPDRRGTSGGPAYCIYGKETSVYGIDLHLWNIFTFMEKKRRFMEKKCTLWKIFTFMEIKCTYYGENKSQPKILNIRQLCP